MSANETFEVRDVREPGWFWLDNEILDQYGQVLGPNGIATYAALARRANQQGQCWPSYNDLRRLTGIRSYATISKYLSLLESLGLIAIQRRVAEDGDRDSNLYILLPVKGGTSRREVPTSPNEVPVLHVVKYGTSPNEVEQDSLNKTTEEQDPLNKTTSRSSSSLTWDTLKDQYGATQVEAAIEAAPPNKRRSLKYVAGILRNWQQEGAPQEAETSGRRYVPEEYADLIEH